jgi:hypothetical protein
MYHIESKSTRTLTLIERLVDPDHVSRYIDGVKQGEVHPRAILANEIEHAVFDPERM